MEPEPEWLIVAPLFDDVTVYSLDEAKDSIGYLEKKKVPFISLLNADAIKAKVEEYLNKFPKIKVGHWDHGNETSWIGDDEQPIIDMNNVELLRNRECYTVNCSSARSLGVEAWKRGATYWGYVDVFYFTTDSVEEFKEAVNSGFKCRVDGGDKRDCLQSMKDRMTQLADHLVATGRSFAGSCLRHDRDILVCYNGETPQTSCLFRRLAIRLFGEERGWRLFGREG